MATYKTLTANHQTILIILTIKPSIRMIKIQCENQSCGSSFFFDEKKNSKAKKVMCPKCKIIQPLISASTPLEEEDPVEDWIKEVEEQPMEDFFSKKKKVPAPVSNPPKINRPKPVPQTKKIGWFVIHDEFTETYTFDLRNGMNRIGRQSNSTPRDVNVAIRTEDKYMSRQHCEIEVKWLHGRSMYEYLLSDKGSSNGTFVNAGKRLSRTDEVSLRDGDTVQIGRTKLVLKLPSTVGSSRDAQNWVEKTDYLKTIIQ